MAASKTKPDRRVVYFLRAAGLDLIKIGVANCVYKRIEAVSLICPVPLEILGVISIPAQSILEQRLHGRFRHLRERGEWFRSAPELLEFIASEAVAPEPKRETRASLLERRLKNALRRQRRAARATAQAASMN